MTGRAPPLAKAGRQREDRGEKRVISELGGRAGERGVFGIELRTADERDCHSDLLHPLPAVVVITRSAYLKL